MRRMTSEAGLRVTTSAKGPSRSFSGSTSLPMDSIRTFSEAGQRVTNAAGKAPLGASNLPDSINTLKKAGKETTAAADRRLFSNNDC
jgi:hypothetical protein